MLEINDLTKKFTQNVALKDITININKGEIYSLIGPNGSGKTTLIKIVAGLLRSTAGTVQIDGHDIQSDPEYTKKVTGYIPDEPTIWPKMTGEEFLDLTGALYDIPPSVRKKRKAKLLKHYELPGIEKMYFEQYSRGNRQKFSILAALLVEPKLLLIDEPIVGLDPQSVRTTAEILKDFTGRGGSVLIATHTLPFVEEISDRIGLLAHGELVSEGSFEELRGRCGCSSACSLEAIYNKLTVS